MRIVSGWDDSPVAGARVLVDGVQRSTEDDGSLTDVVDLRGRAIDIDARGFLPRKTRITAERLTLWPAASEQEVQAIARLVYYRGRLVNLDVRATLRLIREVAYNHDAAFGAAVDTINAVMRDRRFAVEGRDPEVDDGAVWTVSVGGAKECGGHAFFAPYGLCLPYLWFRGDRDNAIVLLTPDALARPESPLRLLALAHLVGDNPLPGLLNPSTPEATELTLLEQQVLRMLPQRLPCTTFPDDDRDRGC